MTDKEIAGAGYILAYLQDLEQLTNIFSGFTNYNTLMRLKYPTEKAMAEVTPEDSERGILMSQNIHFWVSRTYIKYQALKSMIKKFEEKEKEITKLFEEISKAGFPEYEPTQKYTILQNQLFAKNIVGGILTRSKEIYSQFYSQQGEGQAEPEGQKDGPQT